MFLVVHHICNEHLRLHVSQPQLPPPPLLRFGVTTVVASTQNWIMK